ncbi:MAG: 5-formyltetrahydrofolate cyclo-ligase [Actinomycetota bacterium]
MNAGELKRAKREVRRRVLAARDAIDPAAREAMSAAAAQRFLSLAEVLDARTVMAFSSFGSELSMDPLIEGLCERSILVGLPRILEGELQVRSFRPGDPTTTTAFGAREPADGAPIPPAAIDVIVTPGVAFDRAGRRVGYGGGFYDRFFLRTREDARRIGIGAPVQLLAEDLPAGHFDLRVHAIVTPEEIVRCSP